MFAGLRRYTNRLDPLYVRRFENKMTKADFYALAGIVAVEVSAELAGKGDNQDSLVPTS